MKALTNNNSLVVKYGKGKNQFKPVNTLKEASVIVTAYIDSKGLASSQWYGNDAGFVFDVNGTKIGHISYNGRIWDNDNNPVSDEIASAKYYNN